MNIVKFPDPILRERMPEFDFNNPTHDPVELEKSMIDAMLKNGGIGLSANQVGVRARVFVMGDPRNPEAAQAFFNPQVTGHVDEIEDLEEGCLSFPGIFVKIKRPKKIKAQWQNSKGETCEGIFEGYDCKCFLHELDHLEGIVFRDRVSNLKWTRAENNSKRKNK